MLQEAFQHALRALAAVDLHTAGARLLNCGVSGLSRVSPRRQQALAGWTGLAVMLSCHAGHELAPNAHNRQEWAAMAGAPSGLLSLAAVPPRGHILCCAACVAVVNAPPSVFATPWQQTTTWQHAGHHPLPAGCGVCASWSYWCRSVLTPSVRAVSSRC